MRAWRRPGSRPQPTAYTAAATMAEEHDYREQYNAAISRAVAGDVGVYPDFDRHRPRRRHGGPLVGPVVSRLIVVDFDGTITETDTLDDICRRHAPDTWDAAEDGLDGRRLTLREVIRMEMEPVRGEHDAIVAET